MSLQLRIQHLISSWNTFQHFQKVWKFHWSKNRQDTIKYLITRNISVMAIFRKPTHILWKQNNAWTHHRQSLGSSCLYSNNSWGIGWWVRQVFEKTTRPVLWARCSFPRSCKIILNVFSMLLAKVQWLKFQGQIPIIQIFNKIFI